MTNSETKGDDARPSAFKPGVSRFTKLVRGVAVALVVLPIIGVFIKGEPVFLLSLLALSSLGALYSPIAWPYLGRTAMCGFIIWPIAAVGVFRRDPLAFHWLCVISASAALIFVALAYSFSKAFRVVAHKQMGGIRHDVREVLPESLESLRAKGIPIIATTTARETGAGIEYTVTWTDFAMLNDPDPGHMNFEVAMASGVLLAFGLILGGTYGGIGHTMTLIGGLMALALVGDWLFRKYHERGRYSARSVVFRPDGNIAINNPPSKDANTKTDGHSLVIKDGLSRLVSIEYGRTSDWFPLVKSHVPTPAEWYDVFMLFDADKREPVSRSLGGREHAHRISGQLNGLKARLTSTRPRRPQSERIID